MFHKTQSLVSRVYVTVSAAVMLLVLVGVFVAVNWDQMPHGLGEFLAIRITLKNLLVAALFLSSWIIAFQVFSPGHPQVAMPLRRKLIQVSKACLVASVCALLFPLTTSSGAFTDRIILYFLPTAIVASVCGQLVAHRFGGGLARSLSGRKDLIIVGSGPRAWASYELFHQPSHSATRVVGFVDSPNGHPVSAPIRNRMLGGLDDLETILRKRPVDGVLIALPVKSCYEQIQTALHTCIAAGVEARYSPDFFPFSTARPKLGAMGTAPMVSMETIPEDIYGLAVKRGMDVVGALAALIVFSPLIAGSAVAIKLSTGGPVFFAQDRHGFHNHRFRVYKFRTMVPNAEARLAQYLAENPELREEWQLTQKLKNDPRVTWIGRFLRRTSMDELPQLLNVLRGEMSLVGPRPIVESEVERYGQSFAWYRQMVPGLTGLWQVSGRNQCSYETRIEMDRHYVQNWSLKLDADLLVRTVKILVTGYGAY